MLDLKPLSERVRDWWLIDWSANDGDVVEAFCDELAALEQANEDLRASLLETSELLTAVRKDRGHA